jgi:RND family efflux transporter MFP subunit
MSTELGVLLLLGGVAWLVRLQSGRKPAAASEPAAVATPKMEHPRRRDFSERLAWFGTVESKNPVSLTALVPGRVTAVKVEDASLVKRGALLLVLGGPRVTSKLETLSQRVASLEKRVALARSIVKARRISVVEKVAKREELQTAQESLARLGGELAAARQELAAFQDAVSIRAPIDGVFTNRQVFAGQEVEKGRHLADVISRDVRIVAYLFPPSGVSLRGREVTGRTMSGADFQGIVGKVLPERTAEGATIAWIEGGDIDSRCSPGETVSGDVVLAVSEGVLAVPSDAVVRDDHERACVFVKGPRGYERRTVKTGFTSDGWIEIVSGVSQEDEVVVSGAYELFYKGFRKTYRVAD